MAQVLAIGVDQRALTLWQRFLLLSILFHHSNLRLPKQIENRLVRVIVTPRMHGIHHSNVPENQNSNWSGGFTIWDALHRTLNLRVPQDEIDIGVKGLDQPEQVTLPKIITQPFRNEPAISAFLEAASLATQSAASWKRSLHR